MARFCTNCGQKVEDGQSTCMNCGNVVGSGYTQTNQTYQTNQSYTGAVPGQKSRIAAGVLGILLGSLGIHNFYLGYTGKAIAQLLMTLLSCGILGVISGIWGLIEGILILTGSINTDATGTPLGN
ncbi:MAG: TM2 domain-containing protein [Bacilli bacterium]|nr:TM2 domain-containing protein [Bacilli bacterium]